MKPIEMLSDATNRAVVQLPGRKFPGVVLQGDTLSSLTYRLRDLHAAAADDDERADIDEVLGTLEAALEHYEAVLAQRGIPLPYVKR